MCGSVVLYVQMCLFRDAHEVEGLMVTNKSMVSYTYKLLLLS